MIDNSYKFHSVKPDFWEDLDINGIDIDMDRKEQGFGV
jgi:hypothetical protein